MEGLGTHLAIAFGLMLVIEGLLYALFPTAMLRVIAAMRDATPGTLRSGGMIALTVGVLVVWLVRG